MRYFLPILVSFLLFFAGCKEKTEAIVSSETKVSTFSFTNDTLNPGLTEAIYKIEHRTDTGLIYSKDSLRFGTRLDSVIPYITYVATPGIVEFILPDTVVISTGADTLNFSQKPIYLHVTSSDMEHEKYYEIDINVHSVNPNLYVWKCLTEEIFEPQSCETRAFLAKDGLALFVNNGLSTALYLSKNGAEWTKQVSQIPTLPVPCRVREIVQHSDTLFYIDESCLYQSTDLITWTKTDFGSMAIEPIVMLLSYNKEPWCVVQDTASKQLMLATIQRGELIPQKNIAGTTNGFLPSDFPILDFAALTFESSSERPRALIVGGRAANGDLVNSRWSMEYTPSAGYRLKNYSISHPNFESLTGISLIQYDNKLMMFGGINNDFTWRSDILYSTDEGMNWYLPDTANNQMPSTYSSNRYNQTVLVDSLQNIYVIGGQSYTQSFSDVYRGYLNSAKWE